MKNHEIQIPVLLRKAVNETVRGGMPWSATLSQLRKIYDTPLDHGIVDAGRSLRSLNCGVVYFCSDLPDTRSLLFNLEDYTFLDSVSIDSMTLYVSPPHLNWVVDGEQYRRYLRSVILENERFSAVLVSYRRTEGIAEGWEFTNFIEWHFA